MDYNEYQQWMTDLGSGYSSIRPLGEGGMGTLYQAHKDSLDVDVVIKRVKQKFKGRLDERAEANILKTLKHKYLPRIYDVIESPSGYVYTIMDLIEGENMQKYVTSHGPVGQKLAYRWACQLCEVIAYLHSQVPPILHCDIKPSNIMITPNGDICLIDFNTSLVFSKGVLAIGATPGYAAPEQYTRPVDTVPGGGVNDETLPLDGTMPLRGYGSAAAYQNAASSTGSSANYSATAAMATGAGGYGTISKRTDVYGIGATLYFAVTGNAPAHSLKEVRPITTYKLKLSRSFQSILTRAMQKRQEDRFCDAQEMLRALQDIHAIDGRYKSVVFGQRMVAVFSVLLAIAGGVTIGLGVQRIGVERYSAYDSLVRKGRTAGENLQFDEAEKALDEAIAIYDDQLEAYVEKAVLLYRQGRYQECLDAVENARSRDLKYYSSQSAANLYCVGAEANYALGDYASAVTMYQSAIQFAPRVSQYYQELATAQLQLGDFSSAEETLSQMAQAIPGSEQSSDYFIVEGEIARRSGDLESALYDAREAIAASTDDDPEQRARAYRLAADVCTEMGDDALDDEIHLLELGLSELPDSYYNVLGGPLAEAYIRQANATGSDTGRRNALEIYQKMQENGNTSLEVRLNTAMLQYQLKSFADAETTLEALVQDYPKDYRVFMWLAFVKGELAAQKSSPNYAETRNDGQQAQQLYKEAQASGVYDPQMEELNRMMLNYWK